LEWFDFFVIVDDYIGQNFIGISPVTILKNGECFAGALKFGGEKGGAELPERLCR
jgi:hypothetical protein